MVTKQPMKKKVVAVASAIDIKTRVANAVTVLQQLVVDLGLPEPKPLTANQRKQVTRSRKGSEKVIPTLATLAGKYGIEIAQQPTAAMSSAAELAAQLDPLQKQLVALTTLVSENASNAASDSWSTATTLYSVLKRISKRDVKLQKQLAPAAEFFAYRHPLVREKHPKQKGKKAALAAEKQQAKLAADPQGSTTDVPAKPSTGSAGSPTEAGNGAPEAGATKQP
jgi:hypothetical protein